jgi:superfamily I DNA and/or RNA helicase
MVYIFRLFLILNSLSLSFLIFAINKNMTLDWIEPIFYKACTVIIKQDILIPFINNNFYSLLNLSSYIFYFICIILLSMISIYLIDLLSDDSIEEDTLTNIEPANDAFLPSYLGYFFVALSIPNIEMFFVVFGIIAIFIYYSKISYFNPLFFIFGFKFFYVINSNNVKILLITKKELKTTESASFSHLKRITNYTFIDTEKG